MNIFVDNEYILRKQAWEDYQEELAEQENEAITQQLNKTYNRKGYMLNDYKNELNQCY